MIRSSILTLTILLSIQSSAMAEGQVDCASICATGEVMSSYADGTDVACLCVEAAVMDPTVPDPNVPTGVDPDNIY